MDSFNSFLAAATSTSNDSKTDTDHNNSTGNSASNNVKKMSTMWTGLMKTALEKVDASIDKVLDIHSANAQSAVDASAIAADGWGIVDDGWGGAGGGPMPPPRQASNGDGRLLADSKPEPSTDSVIVPESKSESSIIPAPTVPLRKSSDSDSRLKRMGVVIETTRGDPPALPRNVVGGGDSLALADSEMEIEQAADQLQEAAQSILQMKPDGAVEVSTTTPASVVEEVVNDKEYKVRSAVLEEQVQRLNVRISELESELLHEQQENRRLAEDALNRNSASSSGTVEELQKALKTKSEQIQGLLDEGNSLSLQNGKLRDGLKKLKGKLDDLTEERDILMEQKGELEGQVKNSVELQTTVKNLNILNEELQGRVDAMDGDLAAARDKEASLQATIDRAWAEIAELRKSNALETTEAQSAAIEKEVQLNNKLRQELQALKTEYEESEQALKRDLFQYRASVTRLENELEWKEDAHRKEVASYQHKIQSADLRNDDLSQSVQEATKPLLRQIESLQSHNNAVKQTFATLERNLMRQVDDITAERDQVEAEYRAAGQKISGLERQLATMGKQLEVEKQEHENSRRRADEMQHEQTLMQDRLNEMQLKLQNAAKESDDNSVIFRKQLREQLNAEFQGKLGEALERAGAAEDELLDKDAELEKLRAQVQELSVAGTYETGNSGMFFAANQSPYASTVHENQRITSLENQVAQLDSQLKSTLDSKEQLSEKLVQLTVDYNKLKSDSQLTEQLRDTIEELEREKESHVSQIREKSNLIMELSEDVSEMKGMYRLQIEQLVTELGQLKHAAGQL